MVDAEDIAAAGGGEEFGHRWPNHAPGSLSWGSIDRPFGAFILMACFLCVRVPSTVVASLISQHIDSTVILRSLLSPQVVESVRGDGIVVNSES